MRAIDSKTNSAARTFFMFALLVGLNIAVFFPVHRLVRMLLLGIVTCVSIASRLRWRDVSALIMFMLVNFAWMFVMFYFVSFDWLVAAELVIDFCISSLTLALGTFAFWRVTPARNLVTALQTMKIPRSLAFAVAVGILFLPLIAKSIKEIKLSQQARGVKFSPIKLISLIIPAILRILDFSVDMSLSMQSRGYDL